MGGGEGDAQAPAIHLSALVDIVRAYRLSAGRGRRSRRSRRVLSAIALRGVTSPDRPRWRRVGLREDTPDGGEGEKGFECMHSH